MTPRPRRLVAITALAAAIVTGPATVSGRADEPAPAAKSDEEAEQPAEVTTTKQAEELVGWSYLRMHQAESIVGLIEEVQAKKKPASVLDGLEDPGTVKKMLATRWTSEKIHAEAIVPTAPTKNDIVRNSAGRKSVIGKPADGVAVRKPIDGAVVAKPSDEVAGIVKDAQARETGTWRSMLSSSIAAGRLIDPNSRAPHCVPGEVRFPNLYDKQQAIATLHCTTKTDGTLTAELRKGKVKTPDEMFRIVSLKRFSGRFITVPAGATKGGITATAIKTMPEVAEDVTKPPFKTTIAAGQDFEVDVKFAPVFNFATTGAGRYDKLLALGGQPKPIGPFFPDGTGKSKPSKTLPPWAAEVPVSGMFNGLYLGAGLVIPEDSSPTVIKDDYGYTPDVPQPFELAVNLLPIQPSASVKVVPVDLPSGVTMTSASPLVLQANGTAAARGVMTFGISHKSPSIWLEPDLAPHTMAFAVTDSAGKKSTFEVALTLMRGFRKFSFEGDVGCVSKYYVDLTLFPDSSVFVGFYVSSRDHAFRCDADARAFFTPGQIAWKFSHLISRNSTFATHWRSRMKLPAGYRDAITRSLSLSIKATRTTR